MRRRIVLFLLVVWPLQLAWTALSAYCLHESPQGRSALQARHVGHHFHAHQGADGSGAAADLTAAGLSDSDCASCHAAFSALLPEAVGLSVVAASSTAAANRPAPAFTSALVRSPDRPQWRRLI